MAVEELEVMKKRPEERETLLQGGRRRGGGRETREEIGTPAPLYWKSPITFPPAALTLSRAGWLASPPLGGWDAPAERRDTTDRERRDDDGVEAVAASANN